VINFDLATRWTYKCANAIVFWKLGTEALNAIDHRSRYANALYRIFSLFPVPCSLTTPSN
ncbi:MAG: hypothetical protein F6J98_23655, partial [Moorea sp. SIO4G2]|nr:hypothetical protein [Moorena sp. SIO4G2]